jgi:hypothetical protein
MKKVLSCSPFSDLESRVRGSSAEKAGAREEYFYPAGRKPMSWILPVLLLLTLLAIACLPIVFVFWMVKTWRRGRKWVFVAQSAVVLAAVGTAIFLLDLTPAFHWYWERRQAKDNLHWAQELTGVSFPFGKPLYCYDSERAFNGDGYSLAVYELEQFTKIYSCVLGRRKPSCGFSSLGSIYQYSRCAQKNPPASLRRSQATGHIFL